MHQEKDDTVEGETLRHPLEWKPPSADTDFWGRGETYELPPFAEREVEEVSGGDLPIDHYRNEILHAFLLPES